MQVRKLIRILNEMIEKDPSIAYKEVTVDTRWAKSKSYHTFAAINDDDIKIDSCVWNKERTANENWREVLVLGDY